MGYSRRDSALLLAALLVACAWPGPSARAEGPIFGGETPMAECSSCGTGGVCGCCPYLPGEFSTCCPPQRPVWYFQTEAIGLKRDASGNQVFAHAATRTWSQAGDPPVWVSTDSDTVVLSTSDLHFSFQGGGRALVGRTLGSCHAFEVSYFQVTDWNAMATVTPSDAPPFEDPEGVFVEATLLSPWTDFLLPPVPALDENNSAHISYGSGLDNLEWNLRRWLPMPCDCFQVSLLAGGRYMNVDEDFFYQTHSDTPLLFTRNTLRTETVNSMMGVQIGAMFEFFVDPCWWIDCEIKGAAFNNSASQTTVYRNNSRVAPYDGIHRGHHAESTTSFALDLNLTATWQITPTLAVMGGYQALWVDGLVLASANASQDVTLLINGPAAFVDNGKAVYHGPHLGATWAF